MLNPHLDTDSGDLFCLVWHPSTSTLYFGCQNTSIQWFDFRGSPLPQLPSGTREEQCTTRSQVAGPTSSLSIPAASSESIERVLSDAGIISGANTPRRAHKFFDSYPQYERRTPDLNARNPSLTNTRSSTPPLSGSTTPLHSSGLGLDPCLITHASQQPIRTLQVLPENTIWSAHYGYVYSMAVVPSAREGSDDVPRHVPEVAQLVSGSGDATVKVTTSFICVVAHSRSQLLGLVPRYVTSYTSAHLCVRRRRSPCCGSPRRHGVCWMPGWLRESPRPRDKDGGQEFDRRRSRIFPNYLPRFLAANFPHRMWTYCVYLCSIQTYMLAQPTAKSRCASSCLPLLSLC